jgi:hypothetical protein
MTISHALLTTLLTAALFVPARLAGQNVVQNGAFDTSTAGWTPGPGVSLSWSSRDSDDSPASGSALVTNQSTATAIGISQCTSATPGKKSLVLRVFTPSSQGMTGHPYAALEFFANSNCTGTRTGGYGNSFVYHEDKWSTVLQTDHVAAAGTQSVRVSLAVSKDGAGGAFQAYFDDVAVISPNPQTLTIPASASIHGQNGTFFHTDVWLFNSASFLPLTVTARHRCLAGQTCAPGTPQIDVPARSSVLLANIIGSRFGDAETAGAIEISYDASIGNLTANSRTYTPSIPAPTTGTSIPALPASAAKTRGLHVGLGSNGGNLTGGFRSNAGFYNPNASPVSITMTLFAADGTALGSHWAWTLGANEPFQINDIFTVVGAGGTVTTNATLLVVSSLPVFSYVTVVDNQSGDSVYVAASDDIVTP